MRVNLKKIGSIMPDSLKIQVRIMLMNFLFDSGLLLFNLWKWSETEETNTDLSSSSLFN